VKYSILLAAVTLTATLLLVLPYPAATVVQVGVAVQGHQDLRAVAQELLALAMMVVPAVAERLAVVEEPVVLGLIQPVAQVEPEVLD
jgi:hypothetical protein